MDLADKLKLYLVLETELLKLPLEEFLHGVFEAGIKVVQLRDKNKSKVEKIHSAGIVREISLKYNALFIMNDSIELALLSKADGVHLGMNDGSPEDIKKAHSNMIVGYSCNTLDDVIIANKYADYAGIGPYTNTFTKKDHRKVLGMQGIKELNMYLNIPAVAIGGINLDNIRDVLDAEVKGIAVSSYLCRSQNPYNDASALLDIVNERV